MYKVTIRNCRTGAAIQRFLCDIPPTQEEIDINLSYFIEKCYVDVCREPEPFGDTAYFRHEVEADLEPLDKEEILS